MNIFQSIILGIIQGVTEFLPISSSAHLAIIEHIFNLPHKLQLTVFMHLGSTIALIVATRNEIKNIFKHSKIWFLIIGSMPAGVIGGLLSKKVEVSFESPAIIGTCIIITGIILWLTRSANYRYKNISLSTAFIIGIAQAVAILPGISRSGVTIATGIYLGIDRVESAKFSFLLAIISLLGANLITLPQLSTLDFQLSPLIIGVCVSCITSYFAIKWMIRLVKYKNFALFALYCWVVGFVILAIL